MSDIFCKKKNLSTGQKNGKSKDINRTSNSTGKHGHFLYSSNLNSDSKTKDFKHIDCSNQSSFNFLGRQISYHFSNSVKNWENSSSNLLRLKHSFGKSAPTLSSLNKCEKSAASSNGLKKYNFPRSNSPLPSSPDSLNFLPLKRLTIRDRENRRWSVASLPSSGYGTTPGSSNLSSQYSSQEKIEKKDDNFKFRGSLRPRSRSLSSPSRFVLDSEIHQMNILYKERFPKATQQMEERLNSFLNEFSKEEKKRDDPILRFIFHQIFEIARDCLSKSEGKLISGRYFFDMNENLEKLLVECQEKSPEHFKEILCVIKKLRFIILRPARLLECLEFNPEEFIEILTATELEMRNDNIPQYIINKLRGDIDTICKSEFNRSNLVIENPSKKDYVENDMEFDSYKRIAHIVTPKPPSDCDFEILKLISNGAYGAVYLVKNKDTRQRYAMKKINKNNLILRNQVEQVFAERDILTFADNPFVVSMFCSFETKKHLCLVMEYVEGGDCANLLKSIGPLPVDMARFYFAETVLAVEYLHSYGVVHRDLKPDNLLITAFGHIKLTDFGLSKMGLMSLATNLYEGFCDAESRQFSDKQVYGTPEYIAPEVILRQGYGKPVDWWSMGIILYEFLIGCVPFFGETPEELFAHTVNDDIEWPPEEDFFVESYAKNLIEELLQHNPRDRLGIGGPNEIKEHKYFVGLDWNSLLRQKAEFVPQLISEDDTSYFDSRLDRYNHDSEDQSTVYNDLTNEIEDITVFGAFNSFSPQYKKQNYNWPKLDASEFNPDDFVTSSFLKVPQTPDLDNLSSMRFLRCPTTPDTDSLCEKTEFDDIKLRTYNFPPRDSIRVSQKAVNLSTPDSSQTDSDDVSPQIQRKRKTSNIRSILPKFSFSVEENNLKLSEISTISGGSSSTASSRDTSPCREITPLINNLKPPIHIKRGPRGFGFTVHTIRVYFGDTDFYTMHHLVMAVDEASPAFEAGLRAADLITHVNNEPIQGLYHTQVLQLLFNGTSNGTGQISLRATPLDQTSIQTGGRKRNFAKIRFAKKATTILSSTSRQQRKQKKEFHEKKRKASLFRKISSKRASETYGAPSTHSPTFSTNRYMESLYVLQSSKTSPTTALAISSSSNCVTTVSSKSDEFENTESITNQIYQRPSTLHGLKHKIHNSAASSVHRSSSHKSGGRRKSLGHIPLSPLARTPSPSPIPISPTRSPSPLTSLLTPHHLAGASNTTQSYSPLAPGNVCNDEISSNITTFNKVNKCKDSDVKQFKRIATTNQYGFNSLNINDPFSCNSNSNLPRIQEEISKISKAMLTISEENEVFHENVCK